MQGWHRMPFGAELTPDGATHFRLWAPAAGRVELLLGEPVHTTLAMQAEEDGWFALRTAQAGAGTLYRYRIDGELAVPDPATRFQPQDVHGPSEIIAPEAYVWEDDWRGRRWEEAVIYELHIGSFTPAGTFRAVIERLDHLAALGVTAIELMPVADFPGARNWGYDGVLPFAPDSRYGRPEDLKDLVQAAHRCGLMVLLDVVYNHFGPEGNYLHRYAPQFFTERYHTPWGAAINYDGPDSHWVRQFFIHNACYWLEEYCLDGLRLDAVHAIFDRSSPDVLCELAESAQRLALGRRVHLVLENDRNAAHYLRREPGGRPQWYCAQWNDDVHHALHVLLTGEHHGYYVDYSEQPIRHLARCLREGFAYQGERSAYRHGEPRGEPSAGLPPTAFVSLLQNHDQVGNRAFGERIAALADERALRAATTLLLLAPPPPLLFMGQEWGTQRPFPFFCDFEPGLAEAVTQGRRREFARFPEFSNPQAQSRIPDPQDPATFASAVLDWDELRRDGHRQWLALHRELLALRAREIVPRLDGAAQAEVEVRGPAALLARWALGSGAVLTLAANLGPEPAAGIGAPAGRPLFHSTGDVAGALAGGTLPPWSVAWYLAEDSS